jgi:hypothetical protein
MADNNSWHLEKKVQMTVIAMIIMNFGSFIWYMAKMDARDIEQERRLSELERVQDSTQGQVGMLNLNFGRMDERMSAIIEGQKEIKEILSRGRR